MGKQGLNWYRVADPAELPEGRVKVVTAAHTSLALTHYEGKFSALENACPHQGGPLGEGSIENGYLRCPWHGWDYHPCTGKPPGGFDDGVATFPVEEREDGIYVGLAEEEAHRPTVSDVMVETMVRGGGRTGRCVDTGVESRRPGVDRSRHGRRARLIAA